MDQKNFTLDDLVIIPTEDLPTAKIGRWEIKGFREQTLRYLFREIFVDACYSCVLDAEKPLIIDCGANIGFATFYFKHCWPNATIRAFEPAPDTFDLLKQNVLANQLQDVELHNVALGMNKGNIQLYCETNKQGSLRASIVEGRLPTDRTFAVTVPVEPLSKFLNEEVDLLKIDVEGSEDKVIQELVISGKINQVRTAIIEYHWSSERNSDYQIMKRTLVGNRFNLTEFPGEFKDGYRDILLFAERVRRP